MKNLCPFNYEEYSRSALHSEPFLEAQPGLVESLDCYGERLGNRHQAQRRSVEFLVLDQPATSVYGARTCQHSRGPSIWTDSPLRVSKEYAERLANLTQQPGVARLGLGFMCDAITSSCALHIYKAWCPLCLQEFLKGKRAPYVPLLWNIAGSEVCLVHQQWLQTTCPVCQARFRRCSGSRMPVQQCVACGHYLHEDPRMRRGEASQGLHESILAAEALADMLHKLRALPLDVPPTPPDLRKVINSAVERQICSGTMEFLEFAGIPKGTFSALINGEKGSLDLWLRVALAADLSLPGLFHSDFWCSDVNGQSVRWRPCFTTRKRRHLLEWDSIRQTVRDLIASENPTTLYQLGKKLRIDPKHLRKGLGTLAEDLNADAAAKNARSRTAEIKALSERLAEERDRLHQAGARVSARALARGIRCYRRSSNFREAMEIIDRA